MPLEAGVMNKIARFCQVPLSQVLAVRDMPSTYQVPILLSEQNILETCTACLRLDALSIAPTLANKGSRIWSTWKNLAMGLERVFDTVEIALVGKYLECPDSYLSVVRSLEHASMACKRKLKIIWVDAEHLEEPASKKDPASYHKAWHNVCTASGILVPGGFGLRGTEGMINAARWARENGTPYLGICLGMQIAVIEFARTVCGMTLPVATSHEFADDKENQDRIIIQMLEHAKGGMGGTMRLGLRPTVWQPNSDWSRLKALYGTDTSSILERHRHRYEVNPDYIEALEAKGLNFIGKDTEGVRMEIIEMKEHPWFVGVQFHPEYLSRVLEPSKPYLGFVAASAGMLKEMTQRAEVNAVDHGMNGVSINGEHAKAEF